jgi:hypothetical protein
VRNVVSSAVGTAAKLAIYLVPELDSWFAHKLTHLPKTEGPVYDELIVEPMETIMKPFVGTPSAKATPTERGEHAPSQTVGRVQWTQVCASCRYKGALTSSLRA